MNAPTVVRREKRIRTYEIWKARLRAPLQFVETSS
jgi:hypothetical protein